MRRLWTSLLLALLFASPGSGQTTGIDTNHFSEIPGVETPASLGPCDVTKGERSKWDEAGSVLYWCDGIGPSWVAHAMGTDNDAPLAAGVIVTGDDGTNKVKTGGDVNIDCGAGDCGLNYTIGTAQANNQITFGTDFIMQADGDVGFGKDPIVEFQVDVDTGESIRFSSGLNNISFFPFNSVHTVMDIIRRGGNGNAGLSFRNQDSGAEWKIVTNENLNLFIGQGNAGSQTSTIANSAFYIDTNDDVFIPNGDLDVSGKITGSGCTFHGEFSVAPSGSRCDSYYDTDVNKLCVHNATGFRPTDDYADVASCT